MTLINATLLAGILLAGIPVLLHMIMRAKPKRIEFPALRLLQSRQTSNSRRMRLRHLLLLILRGILVAVAVLALTRPSLPAARYGLQWYEWCLLIGVVAAAWGIYQWRMRRLAAAFPADHLLRERRGRLRVFSVLGGLFAALICVGLPWGFRVQAEVSSDRNPMMANLPVAAIFVFDTSLSMTYKHESQTRLEHAVQVSLEHLAVLPQQSEVAVLTTRPDSQSIFQRDLASVQSRIEDLRPHAIARSMNAVIRDAIESHVEHFEMTQQQTSDDLFSREIYLFTDLSEASWDEVDDGGLRDLLVQHQWLQIYLIDVGVPNPINISLSQLRMDRQATTSGQPVNVSVAVSATPAAGSSATLEVFTIGANGEEVPGGGAGGSAQKRVAFEGTPPVVAFAVAGDAGQGTQRGFIRLATTDPMPFDDIRHFTFGVTTVPEVLLVGDDEIDTVYLRNALQPVFLDKLGIKRFVCTSIAGVEFDRETLSNYDVVCLMNWRRPSTTAWSSLQRYVNDGGAVFISAGGDGSLIDTARWSTPAAEAILPGVPLVPLSFRPDPARLNPVAEQHPVVSGFLQSPTARTELMRAVFDRHWSFDWADDSRTIIEFNDRNRRPALVERKIGAGRVLLFTSAMDNNGTKKWNEDFVTNDPWAFLMLADQMMLYLTGASDVERNFTVGDPVEIAVPAGRKFSQYRLSRPRYRRTEGTVAFSETSILLTDIDEAGLYQLRAADEDRTFSIDFAANDKDSESNLSQISDDDLIQLFGTDRFSRVTDLKELDRAVNLGRMGIEVFPVLMGLLVLLFCSEHLMANFFYDEEPAAVPAASNL